ncbi:16S rRNA (uracil(1498)-N(3))-methyltransferase [uncultured Desulfuromonas sp.]|uniref:16S rRNA (uracil(1498)-N(3))-methyltransferase n=1 Tax=uncultured Desulfuromonas sp. TaxID=181013 RepID=UPI0026191561|nr:16S rRNA (uracil(1498)-N(3))-methyltransferase [uncultured Desulfuromonas sp.]
MRRFFVPEQTLCGSEVPLFGETLHHLGTVLRLPEGEEVLLLDGAGTVCRCRIEALAKAEGKARVLKRWQETETAFPVHLYQALPKGERMELVLQKGTELGIRAFTPLLAGRTIPRLPAARAEKRRQRWERIVREAARQCRRPCLPRLDAPRTMTEALPECDQELRLMLWEQGSRPLNEVLPPAPPRSAAILVGPEGGFGADEAGQAREAGFLPVRIGPRILRTETAGFAVAAILQYLYGDLGAGPGGPAPLKEAL